LDSDAIYIGMIHVAIHRHFNVSTPGWVRTEWLVHLSCKSTSHSMLQMMTMT